MMLLTKPYNGIISTLLCVFVLAGCAPRTDIESVVAGTPQKINRQYIVQEMGLVEMDNNLFQDNFSKLLRACSIENQTFIINGAITTDQQKQAAQNTFKERTALFRPDHILEIDELSRTDLRRKSDNKYIRAAAFKYDFVLKDTQDNKVWRAQIDLNLGMYPSSEEVWQVLAKDVLARMQKDGVINCPEAAE